MAPARQCSRSSVRYRPDSHARGRFAFVLVENDTDDRHASLPERLNRQRRVIERSEARTGDDQRRKPDIRNEVDDLSVVRERDARPPIPSTMLSRFPHVLATPSRSTQDVPSSSA